MPIVHRKSDNCITRLLVNLATLMDVVLLLLAEALDEHIRLDKETAALEKEKESVDAINHKIHTSMAQSDM